MTSLVDLDRKYVWHPFTQEQPAPPPLPVKSARGASLFLEDGREILDMDSVMLHLMQLGVPHS